MFGYVMPLKSELRIREFEAYRAFYCGICHAVKRRYGQLPRLMLSYDAVFLALVAAAIDDGHLDAAPFRCFADPLHRRNRVEGGAQIDYAADMLVMLGWLNLKDDRSDERTAPYAAAEALMRRAGKRAAAAHPGKAAAVSERLAQIAALEGGRCASIDRIADPFGHLVGDVFDLPDGVAKVDAQTRDGCTAPLRELGYHVGRFVYIMDAADDYREDRAKGRYNPLLLSYAERGEAAAGLDDALEMDLARIEAAADLLPLRHHAGIIGNIVRLGLRAVKDDVMMERRRKWSWR